MNDTSLWDKRKNKKFQKTYAEIEAAFSNTRGEWDDFIRLEVLPRECSYYPKEILVVVHKVER